MIAGSIIVRYIVLSIMGTLIVRTAVMLNLVSTDPLYQFVLLLQFVVLPAINIGNPTLVTLFSGSKPLVFYLASFIKLMP